MLSHCGQDVALFDRIAQERSIWSGGIQRLGEIPFTPAEGGRRFDAPLVAAPESEAGAALAALAGRIAAALA